MCLQKYVLSLTVEEEEKHEAVEECEPRAFHALMKQQDDIERASQAVLSFLDDGRTVHIVGYDPEVVDTATSLLAERGYATAAKYGAVPFSAPLSLAAPLSAASLSSAAPPHPLLVSTTPEGDRLQEQQGEGVRVGGHGEEDPINKHVLLAHTLSPGGESSHDSCYDSDSSPLGSRENSSLHLNICHSDVSRTVSDTLGAELLSEKEDGPESGEVSPDGQARKVKFALKLGYTQEQLHEAIGKIGLDATQNELLNELINLSSHGEENDDEEEWAEEYKEEPVMNVKKRPVQGSQSSPTVVSPHSKDDSSNLRHIVIDGSNVAMRYDFCGF